MDSTTPSRPSRLVRLRRVVTALLTVGFVTAWFATLVPAAQAAAPAPGDNGDVKTHNVGTSTNDVRDEPKVCSFYLDAFGFDGLQKVSWQIVTHTHGSAVLSGTIALGPNGHGYSGNYALPNGMYKLYWNFDGEHGAAKHKVFKVACTPTPPPTSNPPTSNPPTSNPPTSNPPTSCHPPLPCPTSPPHSSHPAPPHSSATDPFPPTSPHTTPPGQGGPLPNTGYVGSMGSHGTVPLLWLGTGLALFTVAGGMSRRRMLARAHRGRHRA